MSMYHDYTSWVAPKIILHVGVATFFIMEVSIVVVSRGREKRKVKTIAWAEEVSSTLYPSSEPVKLLSHVWLFAIPWTVAHQAPPSTEFSRQEYWSGLPFPSPVDLPNPDIEPGSRTLQADSLPTEPPGKP